MAARRNRHPGIADLLDAESALRALDPVRVAREVAGEIGIQEFRESIRVRLTAKSEIT
jgi:hypothetical protein